MRTVTAVSVIVVFALLFVPPSHLVNGEPKSVEQHRVIVISSWNSHGPITLHRGDVLQLTPFRIPLVPAFLDSSISVKLEGDTALEVIGQIDNPLQGEGSSAKSVFFFAQVAGHCLIDVTLVNEKKEPLESYHSRFEVVVN